MRFSNRSALVAAAVSLPLWWGGYCLLVYPPPPVEMLVGVGAAVVASAATGATVATAWSGYRLPRGWWRTLPPLPLRTARGFVAVVGAGLRPGPVGGELTDTSEPGVGDDSPLGRGRRALLGLTGTVAPDEVVVGFDADRVLVHRLPRRGGAT